MQDSDIVYIRGELVSLETEQPLEEGESAYEMLEMLSDYELSDDAYVNAILREVYNRNVE